MKRVLRTCLQEGGGEAEAYIELAAMPVKKGVKSMAVPSAWRRRHQNLDLAPIVTKELPIDPGCRYDDFPHLVGFGETITFVGGINQPKLVRFFELILLY
jgi:hypothetical protein